jgi:Uncharacterized conserved protein (COG2071)
MNISSTEIAPDPGEFPLASRFLEGALLLTILAHAAAMLSMALLLLPGMPGGSNSAADRVAYIATNPWLWRLGWLPWQLTALSDFILAMALIRTAWIPRYAAILVVITTLIAILIEQPSELAWITQGVTLAQTALQSGNLTSYQQFETNIYLQVAAWAATVYTLAAVGWTWCFSSAKVWQPWLTWLSCITWGILLAVGIGPLLPEAYQPGAGVVAVGNALGFVLMLVWFCAVTELVLRRSRPNSMSGRMAVWLYPRLGLVGYIINRIAVSRLARAYGEWLPPVAFVSNITNVVYANYLVEAERLVPMVPWGLELQYLGPNSKYALFTHLTYQHGHFGPALLGPLRRFMPSPVQSNWRIYVRDPQTSREGIYFVTTAINKALPALLARLLSEGLPMHLVQKGEVISRPDSAFEVRLDPGQGSAPDLEMSLQPTPTPALAPPWSACFDTFHDLLAYCVPQDRALSSQPWYNRVTRQEIELGIPLEACQPLTATIVSRAAHAIVGDAKPMCWRVADVTLRFKQESHDYKTE